MTIFDEITERRLLAGMLTESRTLEMCGDVESADFTDFRHWVVLAAIRKLQADGDDVGPLEVEQVILAQDKERAGFVSSHAGIWFLAELTIEQPPYLGAVTLIRNDIAWLRELATRRQLLEAAA